MKAKIELEKIKLENASDEELGGVAIRLDEIRTSFLPILAILEKAKTQAKELKEKYLSQESIPAEFP